MTQLARRSQQGGYGEGARGVETDSSVRPLDPKFQRPPAVCQARRATGGSTSGGVSRRVVSLVRVVRSYDLADDLIHPTYNL